MSREKKQNWYTNPRKYHFIYKTTCKVNGKFYYGMHSTDNLDDGYVGSGTRLWHSIKKHGRENFSIEILEFLPDRESLKKREAELITEDLLRDPMCMNLALGGAGGEHNENTSKRISQKLTGRSLSKEHKRNISSSVKILSSKLAYWKGKNLSDEHKAKIGKASCGRIMSEEARMKISQNNRGKKRTIEQTTANSARSSKEYLIVTEDGQELSIMNLANWCREHKIDNPRLRLFSSQDQFYRGFKVFRPDRSRLVVKRSK